MNGGVFNTFGVTCQFTINVAVVTDISLRLRI